jgi:hypothetical protein
VSVRVDVQNKERMWCNGKNMSISCRHFMTVWFDAQVAKVCTSSLIYAFLPFVDRAPSLCAQLPQPNSMLRGSFSTTHACLSSGLSSRMSLSCCCAASESSRSSIVLPDLLSLYRFRSGNCVALTTIGHLHHGIIQPVISTSKHLSHRQSLGLLLGDLRSQ